MATWGQRAAAVQSKPDGQSSITGGLDSDNADEGQERPGRDGDDVEVGQVGEVGDDVEVGEVGDGGEGRMTGGEGGKWLYDWQSLIATFDKTRIDNRRLQVGLHRSLSLSNLPITTLHTSQISKLSSRERSNKTSVIDIGSSFAQMFLCTNYSGQFWSDYHIITNTPLSNLKTN